MHHCDIELDTFVLNPRLASCGKCGTCAANRVVSEQSKFAKSLFAFSLDADQFARTYLGISRLRGRLSFVGTLTSRHELRVEDHV